MIQLLIATARKTNILSAQLFKDAYDYNEIRMYPEDIMFEYEESLITDTLPKIVEDYCLDIFAGRIQIQDIHTSP